MEVSASVCDENLIVRVGDTGPGGADERTRQRPARLADRVEAVGGRLTIDSPAGGGTRLVAEFPCG